MSSPYARTLGRPDLSNISAVVEQAEEQPVPDGVAVYLGRSEVALFLGLKNIRSLNGVRLPLHDAQIGDRKGWLPETIETWRDNRPGRGRWGAR